MEDPYCQMLWRTSNKRDNPLVCHFSVVVVIVRDPDAVLGTSAGEDVGDELVRVDSPPSIRGRTAQLVGRRQLAFFD